MQDKFRWLLVGAGNIARIRARAALRDAENSELAAICDLDTDKAKSLAEQLELDIPIYTNYAQALLESGADGVYIATTPASHVELGLKAVEAQKHFLTEKPLGLDTTDSLRLYNAGRNAGIKTACSDYRRLSEQYKVVEKLVRNGALGEFTGGWMNWITSGKSCGNTPLVRALGGSPVKTLTFYIIDIIHNLFGMPSEVQARCCNSFNPSNDTEDVVCVTMSFPNGALFSMNIFLNNYAAGQDKMEFYGTDGCITLQKWPPYGNGPVIYRGKNEQEKTFEVFTNTNWHIPMIEDFIAAVKEDREPVCTILSALKTEIITDAVFQAETSGKVEPVITEGVI